MGLPDIETIPETGAVFTIGRSRFADNVASHFFIRKDPVVSITCGDEHSAVVCQTGRLFVFGSNDWGQLGLGHKTHISKPSCVKILKPEKVTHVACGRAHTLICTGAQKIFACGSNQEGQLGRESSAIGDSSSSPILIYDCGLVGPRIVQIAAGSHHSMALTSDGGVVAWGSNLEGQLGLSGISGLVNKPTKVPIPEPVKEIGAGYYHSAFLTESGLVYVCGESESGKLGIHVNFSAQVAPKQMQLPAPAVHVACGGHHTLVLAENGSIYCSGSNANGQLGMGTNVGEIQTPKLLPRGALRDETVVKITCGESHSAVLTASGKLFTCGDGRHGKLGLEENENNVHELTFAAKYQELFVSNVSCGGCHTILVGRRHEIDYPAHRQFDSTEQPVQKKSSLPPLKLPVNMQNEQRADKEENSMDEKEDSWLADTRANEMPGTSETPTNSSEKCAKENQDPVNDIPTSEENTKVSSNSASPEISKEETIDDSQSRKAEVARDDDSVKSEGSDKSIDSQRDNEETAVLQEIEESQWFNRVEPPPKPPRLKAEGTEDNINGTESPKKSEESESTKEYDAEEGKTVTSNAETTNVVEAIANSIEKPEEENDNAAEAPDKKTEIDRTTQDDADVVQSPVPRTGKMATLFKAKRQQEIRNGTKSNVANPKAKSKTCTVL